MNYVCVDVFGVVFDLCLCCVFVRACLMACSLVVAIVVQVFGILVPCSCLGFVGGFVCFLRVCFLLVCVYSFDGVFARRCCVCCFCWCCYGRYDCFSWWFCCCSVCSWCQYCSWRPHYYLCSCSCVVEVVVSRACVVA